MSPERRIRRAVISDLPAIRTNFEIARETMAAHGNPTQWGTTRPLDSLVVEDVRAGRCMLLVDHVGGSERVLAQFSTCLGANPSYARIDGAWLDDEPYATMHRIASSGTARHCAQDCLEWMLDEYGNVRADTHENNHAMQHILAAMGFHRCGLITLQGRASDAMRIAYQRHDRNC